MPRQSNLNVSISAKNSQAFGKMAQTLEKLQDDNLTTKHFTPEEIELLSTAETAIRSLKKTEQSKIAVEESNLESRVKDAYDNVKAKVSTDETAKAENVKTSSENLDSTTDAPTAIESKEVSTKAK